jgi:hypothetical protein
LLDEDFWDKHQVADAAKLEPGALVEKLTGLGVASISLSEAKRAKMVNCKVSENAALGKAGGDRCLQLGDAVVDLRCSSE